ncbi:Catenin alpha [Trichinella pseudospiralis]
MEDCPGTDLPAFYTTGTTIFWHQPALSTSSSKLVPWFKAFERKAGELVDKFADRVQQAGDKLLLDELHITEQF